MNLKEQLYVCTVAEFENLSDAAEQLFITQAALSLYISSLENRMGVQLFDRKGKKFQLTHMGELYVQKATQMLDLKASFDLELASYLSGYKERLRIGMQEIRSNVLSPKIIQRFCQAFPQVDLIWYEGNYVTLIDLLANNQIDMFFCNCPNEKREYNYESIYTEKLMFAASIENAVVQECLAKNPDETKINLVKFVNERFILQNENQSIYTYSKKLFKEYNIAPKNVFTMRKISPMLTLIDSNFGVGFCPESYIEYASKSERVKLFDVGKNPVPITFAAVYKSKSSLSKYGVSLIEMVRELM